MTTIDLTPVFQAVIALLAALITTKLIPWIKKKTTEQQLNNLKAAAMIAVYAAEQIYGAGQGEEKLRYAMERLEDMGFHMDVDLLREAIEEQVYNLMPKFKPLEIPDGGAKQGQEEENNDIVTPED